MKELIAHAASIASMKEKEMKESTSKDVISKNSFTKEVSKNDTKQEDTGAVELETNPNSEGNAFTSKIETPKSVLTIKKEPAKMVRIQ